MAKITRKQVANAHDAYGDALARWGENNLLTERALQRYWELRAQFDAETLGIDPRA